VSVSNGLYESPRFVADTKDCFFYHTIELPEFGLQKGEWDLRGEFADYIGNVSLTGKRVLDIGCASGFLSISAEAAGAREVVSFDMDDSSRQHWLPFHKKLAYTDPVEFRKRHNLWVERWKNAYWLVHRLMNSKAKVVYGDVYDIPTALGSFDVVLVCSILEHLSDQVRALASAARVAADTIIITTPLIETSEKIARFEGDAARPEVDYVWWLYSIPVYREVLAMLGFTIERIEKKAFLFENAGRRDERHIIVSRRRPELPAR
jgi:SAM-dependent methyltransferase